MLLSTPLNVPILRALNEGPKQQVELRQEAGSPAQTTLRAQLKRLEQIGAIEKQRQNRFPGVLEYELSGPGRDLLVVADTLERWLDRAPDGALRLGDNTARSAIKALAEAWSATMLRPLAGDPMSLTELDRVIGALSYPSLERRLAAMRLAGQVEARSSSDRGTPYALTDWARRGVAPLAAAARWEQRHLPKSAPPIRQLDVEAAFLLSVPLLRVDGGMSGSCRMAAEIPGGRKRQLAGVVVHIEGGRIESYTSRLQGTPSAWALGSVTAWLDAVIDAETSRIEPGGDTHLARTLLDALHGELFGERSPATT